MEGEFSGHIVVLGAGLVGGYLGGRLAHAGARVTLLGRAGLLNPVQAHGMRITDVDGADLTVTSGFSVAYDPAVLSTADLVLVCVKAGATAQAGADLAAHARPGTIVVSFQNGVDNAAVLVAAAPHCTVLAGMVPYNITQVAPGHWHRGTGGRLYAQRTPAMVTALPLFARAGLPMVLAGDMQAVLWAKLLTNLNNAVNALSGQPLLAQLSDRNNRRVLAACMDEALAALGHARITPAQIGALAPEKIPRLLRLPNFLYRWMALRRMKIDATARSSMAEDLAAGKPTEIDDINGAVVALGSRFRSDTPVNARIIELVRAAEAGVQGPMTGSDLRRAVGL